MFDKNGVPVKLGVHPKMKYVEAFNLGTQEDPEYIKLSKFISAKQKQRHVSLFKEYIDVFFLEVRRLENL